MINTYFLSFERYKKAIRNQYKILRIVYLKYALIFSLFYGLQLCVILKFDFKKSFYLSFVKAETHTHT